MKTIWTKLIGTLLLMATTSQGAWAQATVSDKGALRTEVNKDNITVTLGDDITLDTGDLYEDGRLDVRGVNVTLDLNGHTLRRVLEEANAEGQVIFLKNGAKLTIIDSSADNSGQITGGRSHQGGAIYVEEGGELTISGGTITGNRADQISGGGYGFGGAIENHGTVTITGGVITGNTAGQFGGGIHNEGTLNITGGTVTGNTAGTYGGAIYSNRTVSISGITLSGNTAQLGGGAICSEGTLTLDGVTISGNSAQNGGGIYMFGTGTVQLKGNCTITGNSARTGGGILQVTNGAGAAGPTLKMEGKPVVQGNTTSDVYLQSYQLITVSGAFSEGARIGVCTEVEQNAFTASFSQFNPAVAPSTFFFVSSPVIAGDVVWNDNQFEARIQQTGYAYVERAWDEENKKVTETIKTCTSFTPINGNNTSDEGWLGLSDGWYVVTGNSNYKALVVEGTDVKLIIPDGVTLYVNHVKLETGHKLTIYSQCEDSGTLDAINDDISNAAGIGGGNEASCGTLVIHGGVVQAQGDENGAGIGSGKESPTMAGYITIYGGTVSAKGGLEGAGIGGGYHGDGAILHIYGGTIEAKSPSYLWNDNTPHGFAAGIGGGNNGSGVETHIYGGNVTATSGYEAACIGGGTGNGKGLGNGGLIEISGGHVKAHRTRRGGAAIGCGYYGESATIVISGGFVDAELEEPYLGACIGGGGGFNPILNITISGGTVMADSGGRQGIGAGGDYGVVGLFSEFGYQGTLSITGGIVYARGYERALGGANFEECLTRVSIPDNAMVMSGNSPNEAAFVEAGLRLSAVLSHKYIYMEKCIHSGLTYTVSGPSSTDTHLKHCAYCLTPFEAEQHTFVNGKCTVCGVELTTYQVTVNVPANNGAVDGVYEPFTYQMVPGTTFKLPASPITFSDRVFAGWLVGTPSNNSYRVSDGEELLAAGEEYTINGDVTFSARYSYIYIQLADNADNSEALFNYNGKKARGVTLSGRTLYKDGAWNTLCLPFNLDNFTGTPLAGATVKTLSTTDFTDGTLTLNFSNDLTAIEAGKPYIVKWDKPATYVPYDGENASTCSDVVNPVFSGVTIANTTQPVTTDELTFHGLFAPFAISGENRSLLYLGSGNTLYYPDAAMTIGAFRAFFLLADGITAGNPSPSGETEGVSIRSFVLNFGDDTNGITEAEANASFQDWFSLDGRRLSGKPAQKGLYLHNGRKVMVK